MKSPILNHKLIFFTLVAALGGFLYGFDTAVINGALPFFTGHFDLSDVMTGWAVSSALLGCIVGAISAGVPGDRFGRRQVLKVSAENTLGPVQNRLRALFNDSYEVYGVQVQIKPMLSDFQGGLQNGEAYTGDIVD